MVHLDLFCVMVIFYGVGMNKKLRKAVMMLLVKEEVRDSIWEKAVGLCTYQKHNQESKTSSIMTFHQKVGIEIASISNEEKEKI
jgi:hypothetical protein